MRLQVSKGREGGREGSGRQLESRAAACGPCPGLHKGQVAIAPQFNHYLFIFLLCRSNGNSKKLHKLIIDYHVFRFFKNVDIAALLQEEAHV